MKVEGNESKPMPTLQTEVDEQISFSDDEEDEDLTR
jgi:hypothetical protein